MRWLLDLDDTLCVGPISWALEHVLPDLIALYHLSDAGLPQALLKTQEMAGLGASEDNFLDYFLQNMNWPTALKQPLIQRTFEEFRPTPFDDALPFLQASRARGDQVYILSNNRDAAAIINGLGWVVDDVFTPHRFNLARGKPNIGLWAAINFPVQDSFLVGDDPWSDGLFAQRCGLTYRIIDRLGRYAGLGHPLIHSLRDLLVETPS